MALREFKDQRGRFWQVWDVRPKGAGTTDRRTHERRSPDPFLAHTGEERRTGYERRKKDLSGKAGPSEWLTCECKEEKRRLTPIPHGWDEMSDAELESLCSKAEKVDRAVYTMNFNRTRSH